MAPDFTDMFLDKVRAFIDVVEEKTFYIDIEMKRRVRDAEYWGAPVGTLIVPGMKPRGTRTVKKPSAAKPRAKKKATVAKKKTTAKRAAAKKATPAKVTVTPAKPDVAKEKRGRTKARAKKIAGAVALGAAGGVAKGSFSNFGARVLDQLDLDKLIQMIPSFGAEESSATSRKPKSGYRGLGDASSARGYRGLDTIVRDWADGYAYKEPNPEAALKKAKDFDRNERILNEDIKASKNDYANALAAHIAIVSTPSEHPASVVSIAQGTLKEITPTKKRQSGYKGRGDASSARGWRGLDTIVRDWADEYAYKESSPEEALKKAKDFDRNENIINGAIKASESDYAAALAEHAAIVSSPSDHPDSVVRIAQGTLKDALRWVQQDGTVNAASKKSDDIDLETTDYIKSDSFYEDVEMKKRVRDADYWGQPVGTLITPGMKPKGKKPKVGTVAKKTPAKKRALKKRIVPKKRAAAPKATGSDAPKKPAAKTPAKKATAKKPSPSTNSDSGSEIDTTVRKAEDFSVKDAASVLGEISVEGRVDGEGTLEDPIDCGDNITKAHMLLAEGKHIRLNTEMQVSLLIDRLAEEADFAKERGEETPDYDLCKVTVPKTNLFCLESKGVPREQMPQFSGTPVEGSYADASMKRAQKEAQRRIDAGETRDDGKAIKVPDEANVMTEFGQLLEEMGIEVELTEVSAQELKATQNNLVGTKVAGMRRAMKAGKVAEEAIYVTRDGYIVDGHHRWAAKIGLGLEDGVDAEDIKMPVRMIDAEIGYILDVSNGFARMAGIKPKATGKAADGVKMMSIEQVWNPCVGCEKHVY